MHTENSYKAGASTGVKKRILLPISALLLFAIFTSCSANSGDVASITEHMRKVSSATYVANITANFPSREVEFTLNYNYSKNGDDRISVLAPSDVAGVSLSVSQSTSTLEFDGAQLELGKLNDNGLSPFSAISSLITTWVSGSYSEVDNTKIFGKDATLIISRVADGTNDIEYRTWFSKEEALPLYAEVFSDGRRVIQCEFERAEHILQ